MLNYFYYTHCSTTQQEIILCDSVKEKCIVMDLIPELGLVFVSQFPNSLEMD